MSMQHKGLMIILDGVGDRPIATFDGCHSSGGPLIFLH